MKLLLIVDNPVLCRELSKAFVDNKYRVDTASDGEAAFCLMSKSVYDLAILGSEQLDDLGIGILKKIQLQNAYLPVIFLSKNYNIEELLAKVKSLLRRSLLGKEKSCICFGDLEFHFDICEVRLGNETYKLTKKQSQIMELLVRNSGSFVPKEKIFNSIWGTYRGIELSNIDVHIHHLRKKPFFEKTGMAIETRRGVGYCLWII